MSHETLSHFSNWLSQNIAGSLLQTILLRVPKDANLFDEELKDDWIAIDTTLTTVSKFPKFVCLEIFKKEAFSNVQALKDICPKLCSAGLIYLSHN